MPLDTTRGVVLTVTRRGARREPWQFPQLAQQVRCSSGFTSVPRGRVEVLRPERRQIAGGGALNSREAALLAMLESHARQHAALPAYPVLADELGPDWSAPDVAVSMAALQVAGMIRMEASGLGRSPPWRMLVIIASGAVLRSFHAPRQRRPV